MSRPLISVIVPVYNGEAGIARCIDSITSQTYKEIEVIVIDDGSTDETSEIIDELAEKDGRIKPFHIKNGGVSAARNLGIEKSEGEYIMFVDGDDTIAPLMLERMEKVLSEGNDFVHCAMKRVTDSGKELPWNYRLKDKKLIGKEAILADFFRKNVMSTSCAKLYRNELVKDIRFDKTFAVGEDELFSYNVCKNSVKAEVISEAFYFYTDNEDSVMNKSFQEKHFQALSVMDIQLEDVKDNKELYKLCAVCDVIRSNELMWRVFASKAMYDKFPYLRERMLRHKKYYLGSSEITPKDKLLYVLLWLMPKLYYKLKLKQNS